MHKTPEVVVVTFVVAAVVAKGLFYELLPLFVSVVRVQAFPSLISLFQDVSVPSLSELLFSLSPSQSLSVSSLPQVSVFLPPFLSRVLPALPSERSAVESLVAAQPKEEL